MMHMQPISCSSNYQFAITCHQFASPSSAIFYGDCPGPH